MTERDLVRRLMGNLVIAIFLVACTAFGLAVGYLYGSFDSAPHGEIGRAAVVGP